MTGNSRPTAEGSSADSAEEPIREVSIEQLVECTRAAGRGEVTLARLAGITPDDLYRLADFGYGQVEAGRWDEARLVFEELVSLSPYDAYFHAMLGSIAQRQGEHAQAAGHYGRAIELDPEDAFSWVNRGEVLLHLCREALDGGRGAEARRALEEASTALGRARGVAGAEAGRAGARAAQLAPAVQRFRILLESTT